MAVFIVVHCRLHGDGSIYRCVVGNSFGWPQSRNQILSSQFYIDMLLYTLIVPILPYMSETRLGLDASHTQNMSFALLSETAIVTVILSPIVGHYADKTSTKRILD